MSSLIGFLRLSRLPMSLIIGLTALAGTTLACSTISIPTKLLLFVSETIIAMFGFAINDILDRNRDINAEWKPLTSKQISLKSAIIISIILFVLSLILLMTLNQETRILGFTQIIILILYSYIKVRNGILGNLITALLCSTGFIFGSISLQNTDNIWILPLLTFEMIFSREIVKDIMDFEVDKLANLKTIPILFGKNLASSIILFMSLLMTITASLLSNTLPNNYKILFLSSSICVLFLSFNIFRNCADKNIKSFLICTSILFPLITLYVIFHKF